MLVFSVSTDGRRDDPGVGECAREEAMDARGDDIVDIVLETYSLEHLLREELMGMDAESVVRLDVVVESYLWSSMGWSVCAPSEFIWSCRLT